MKEWTIILDAKDEGREEGQEEERNKAVQALMTNLKLSLEQAMDALNIPKDERVSVTENFKEHNPK